MFDDFIYECESNGVIVRVIPAFIEEESDPDENIFFWAYRVEIENTGSRSLTLIGRRWRITDQSGCVREVTGRGVVGQEPTIRPGGVFQYTSGAPLNTPSGIMQGDYDLADENGQHVSVQTPAFSLDSPYDTAARH